MNRADLICTAFAFVAMSRKSWLISTRVPLFWGETIVRALVLVLPTLLAVRALAGPNEDHLTEFSTISGTTNYLAFAAAGVVGWAWWNLLTVNLSLSIRTERNAGTLHLLWTSPAPQWILVFANASALGVRDGLLAAGMFAASILIYQFPISVNLLLLILVLLAGLASSASVGLITASIVIRHRHSFLLAHTAVACLSFLAGIAYPITILPEWLQNLASVTPPMWVIRGLRASLVVDDVMDGVKAAAILLLQAVAYGAVGLYLFGSLSRAVRKQGRLEAY